MCVEQWRMKDDDDDNNNNNKGDKHCAWSLWVYIYIIGSCVGVVMVVVFGKYESGRINYI